MLWQSFQSTHPVWDGTYILDPDMDMIEHFNPPIPCGMGRHVRNKLSTHTAISIHPSRVGWDCNTAGCCWSHVNFNPPIPCGMGLELSQEHRARYLISIHPSRVGWDGVPFYSKQGNPPFQSTHPVWDGTAPSCHWFASRVFQSTHPVWDGT